MMIGTPEWREVIRDGAGRLGVDVPGAVLDQFAVHARELLLWNSKINLTAITDPLAVAVNHYIDAIAPANLIPAPARVLDIGTGGGFPGLPLKLLQPALTLTLIDAARKKVSFLNHVGRVLHLTGYRAVHLRLEKLKSAAETTRPAAVGLGPFDVIVSRALASLEDYLALAVPLVAAKGLILALKGRISAAEVATARRFLTAIGSSVRGGLGVPELTVKHYRLPVFDSDRSIVVVRFG
ncbi:MAG: 16S rRNA (guanine(527)-N(7))-methyltransferase RsmG [Desulfobacterales bacterium]